MVVFGFSKWLKYQFKKSLKKTHNQEEEKTWKTHTTFKARGTMKDVEAQHNVSHGMPFKTER